MAGLVLPYEADFVAAEYVAEDSVAKLGWEAEER